MTIERIEIRNFQCHRKLIIDLDPFVTCIVGESDSGKSSILRAFRWLCLNRPSGSAFVRFGHGDCRVRAIIEGETISRQKGDKGNHYKLGGNVFNAFGTGIPDQIGNLLNVSELNFQRQHDPPFWFGLSPGEVSKELNQIINLGLIDSTLANAASELRQAKVAVSVTESRLDTAQKELEESKFAEEMDSDLKELEELQQQISEKTSRIAQDQKLLEEWGELLERKKKASENVLDASEDIQEIEAVRERLEAVSERREQLETLYSKWEELCQRKEDSLKDLREAESGLSNLKIKSCPLCGQKVTL